MNNWINCDDSLPPYDKLVLLANGDCVDSGYRTKIDVLGEHFSLTGATH